MLRRHREAQEREQQNQDPGWNPSGLVFLSDSGAFLNYDALRHTCASLMLQAGVGIAEIAAHLGDDPAIVSRVYAHILEQTKRQVADRFARFLEDNRLP